MRFQWLGQLQTVNFVQNAKYTIEYMYSGVQCSAIDVTEVETHVFGSLNVTGLGFMQLSPTVVSQSGPSSCDVRVPVQRVDATTLFDVGPTGPFSGVSNAKLNAILDESGKDLFRAPQPVSSSPPTPSPPTPSPPTPSPPTPSPPTPSPPTPSPPPPAPIPTPAPTPGSCDCGTFSKVTWTQGDCDCVTDPVKVGGLAVLTAGALWLIVAKSSPLHSTIWKTPE
jgi:hypothetical protein